MDNIGWSPIEVTLTGGVCTSGQGGDQGKTGIYLGVDKKSHKSLLDLTRLIRHYGGKETLIDVGPRIDAFRVRKTHDFFTLTLRPTLIGSTLSG